MNVALAASSLLRHVEVQTSMEVIGVFLGKWIDGTGKVLVIGSGRSGFLVDFYQSAELKPVSRKMPMGEPISSLNMVAYLDGAVLVVELGLEGLGATLRLSHGMIEGKENLIPEIVRGLYWDWEEDFGVPWVFPLSPYSRAELPR